MNRKNFLKDSLLQAYKDAISANVASIAAQKAVRHIANEVLRNHAVSIGYSFDDKWLIGFSDGDAYVRFEYSMFNEYSDGISVYFRMFSKSGKEHKTKHSCEFESLMQMMKPKPLKGDSHGGNDEQIHKTNRRRG